jgi:hypothetical protein
MYAKANIAPPTDFNKVDNPYRQAVTASSNANSVAAAPTGFNQAAAAFTAATNATETKLRQAEEAIAKAKERGTQSVTHATNVGHTMDGIADENTEAGNE